MKKLLLICHRYITISSKEIKNYFTSGKTRTEFRECSFIRKFDVYINYDKSCCDKLYQKSELSQGLKESKLGIKKIKKNQQ